MLNLYHIATVVPLEEDSVYLHQTPMFHAASMGGIMGMPASGGTSVFMPLFDPAAALDLIEQPRRDPDDDGADDDRHDGRPRVVRARTAGIDEAAHLRRLADAGRTARPADLDSIPISTSRRATA